MPVLWAAHFWQSKASRLAVASLVLCLLAGRECLAETPSPQRWILLATALSVVLAAWQEKSTVVGAHAEPRASPHPLAPAEVLRELPDLLVTMDCTGRVRDCNAAVEVLLDRGRAELLGADWFTEFATELDRPDLRQTFQQMLSHGVETNVTHQLETPHGRRDIQWHSRTINDCSGKPRAVLAVGRDVTDMKRAQQHTVQSQRLAAIGQMVAGLAHESGNALQRSQACLDMLALQLRNQPESLDLVYRIQIAQDRLSQLYQDLQRYAAPIVLRRKPVALRDLIEAAWDQLRPKWQDRRVILRWQPVAWNWIGHVDPSNLESVFRNILANALEACSDPVEIAVACDVMSAPEKERFRLTFRDNGPGLDHESRERIFQPFFTTKTQGTGLGMSISRRAVEAHGGSIAVSNLPQGCGAEIVVFLPKE